MQITVSVPGKVTLFGEHAVVYGKPALVSAISKRIYVTMEKREDLSIRLVSPDLKLQGFSLTFKGGSSDFTLEAEHKKILEPLLYIMKAIEIASQHIGKKTGTNIIIRSEMPIGAGLGTSAAISVGTIAAYASILGEEIERHEIAKMGHATEVAVQGIASPMDTAITTFGGTLYIKPGGERPILEPLKIPCEMPSVLGYVEREETTSQILKRVKAVRESNPNVVDLIMEVIGLIAEEAKTALIRGDLKSLGALMNMNHGLLDSLGVSNKRLNEMVYASRSAGALGSKVTGAGGGGCILALCPERVREVSLSIKLVGGTPFEVSLSSPGLRTERCS